MTNKKRLSEYKRIQVHGGIFHCDDVMCVLLARRANAVIEIIRGGEPLLNDSDALVADYGDTLFDHHNIEKIKTYKDGIMLSACGLMMEAFGEELFPIEYVRHQILENVIRGIDAVDNGQIGFMNNLGTSLEQIVSVYNLPWNKKDNIGMERFMQALSVVEEIFEKEMERIEANYQAQEIIEEAYEKSVDKRIVVLEQYVPAKEYFAKNTEDVQFIVFSSDRGGFNLVAVPPDMKHAMEQRCPIALEGKDRIPGVIFIHRNQFLAAVDTVEHAIELARFSMEKKEQIC